MQKGLAAKIVLSINPVLISNLEANLKIFLPQILVNSKIYHLELFIMKLQEY